MRCTHLNRVSEQCQGQTVAGSTLCAYHAGILEGRSASSLDEESDAPRGRRSRFPLIYRIAAALLALIFLLPFFETVKHAVQGWFNR